MIIRIIRHQHKDVCPDHYININLYNTGTRREEHSIEAVPFVIWNNKEKDDVTIFSEDAVLDGTYGKSLINHLELLLLMGEERENLVAEKATSKLN